MLDRFTNKAKQALTQAKQAAGEFGHNYIGTEHILIGLLQEGSGVAAQVLQNYGVDAERVYDLVKQLIAPTAATSVIEPEGYTPRATRVLDNSYGEARRMNSSLIGTEHILIAIIKEPDCAATKLLNTMNVSIKRIYVDLLTATGQDANDYREEVMRSSSNRRQAEHSATPVLDQYSRDLTKLAREGKLDPVIGREQEISHVIQILSRRTKNNPCLIGEPGVGKTAIVEGLASRIVEGNVPDTIIGKRVVTLDLSSMVAGS
ncbi:MAG: Clp protease N-terminal domain-containing protein, partial [Lachnospiraceae bacterium]